MNVEFQVPHPSLFNAYYASNIGLLNGMTLEDNLILMSDSRNIQTYRVTSHELRHLIGLGHVHDDDLRLMYKGMVLNNEEIKTARDSAKSKLAATYRQD